MFRLNATGTDELAIVHFIVIRLQSGTGVQDNRLPPW